MLQIITKMYFREGANLHETVQRGALFTNATFLRSDVVEFPVGELAPATDSTPVTAMMASITEYLEREGPEVSASLVATDGLELLDQFADVLSFGLDAIFSRDRDLVRRVVPTSIDVWERNSQSRLLRRTFEPHRFITADEVSVQRELMSALLALRRPQFERVMRAIRRIVRATTRAETDPTVAYTDIVAGLESLAEETEAPAPGWDAVPKRAREIIDHALDGLEQSVADGVRAGMIEAERLGLHRRFIAFVLEHITPSYFRGEALDAVNPMTGANLERALSVAYGIRSSNVHLLEDLPAEAWVLGGGSDTVELPEMGSIFSLEGLRRLARHVIGNYIDRAPTGIDQQFAWREALPGILRMRAAPRYWIWNATSFNQRSANRYFSGFLEDLADRRDFDKEPVADLTEVLKSIETLLPATAGEPPKRTMIAMYALWHRMLSEAHHRPNQAAFLLRYGSLLQTASVPAFAISLYSDALPSWSPTQWMDLADTRRVDRGRLGHLELPQRFDAALQAISADVAYANAQLGRAKNLAARALEEAPGSVDLMTWERAIADGGWEPLDVLEFVFPTPGQDGGRNGDVWDAVGDDAA